MVALERKQPCDVEKTRSTICRIPTCFTGALGFDHIIIPQPEDKAGVAGTKTSRFCGSTLVLAGTGAGTTGLSVELTSMAAKTTVCSKSVPFNVRYMYFSVFFICTILKQTLFLLGS